MTHMPPHPRDPSTVSSSGWMVSLDEQAATAVRLDLSDGALTMWPFNADLFAPPDPEPRAPIVLPLQEVVGLDQLGADVIQPLVEFCLSNGERYRLRTTEVFLEQILTALEATRQTEPPLADPELADLPEVPPRSQTTSKRALLKEIDALRSYIASLGVAERSAMQSDIDALTAAIQRLTEHRADVLESVRRATAELGELRDQVVALEREAALQGLGVYRFAHPVDDEAEPSQELTELREQIERRLLDGDAIRITSEWVVNGSEEAGHRMAADLAALLLRTYNAEADLLIRGLHPFDLVVATDRLDASAKAVARLGSVLEIAIDPEFHRLRIREMRLVARQHAAARRAAERNVSEATH